MKSRLVVRPPWHVEELRKDVGNRDPKHPAEHGIAPML